MPEAPGSSRRPTEHELARELNRVEDRLSRLDRDLSLTEWRLYTGQSTATSERLQLRRSGLLRETGLGRFVRSAQDLTKNPILNRRLELLHRAIVEASVEQDPAVVRLRTRLQSEIVRYRPRWRGRRVGRAEVREILRKSPKRGERRLAFYAEDPLRRGIERGLRDLVCLRNEKARGLGFRSFPQARLQFEGFTVPRLRDFVRAVLRPAPRLIREFRDSFLEREGVESWYPWDLEYARQTDVVLPDRLFPARRMVSDVLRAVGAWGFPPKVLKFRVVRHDLPFGGLTFPVVTPSDIRVLVHPAAGWERYLVLFHEFGHAVHASSVRETSHLLRSADQGFGGFFEGIADLFEEIPGSVEWLSRRGIDGRIAHSFSRSCSRENLLRATMMGLWVELEQALYERPDGDPTIDLHRRTRALFGFDEYEEVSFADTFYVLAPVYSQSYVFSLCFRKQVLASLLKVVEDPVWPNPKVGPWLTRNFLRSGSSYDWVARIREVTGKPFGPADFVSSILK